MTKSTNLKRKWLPLALVPLFSVAVLAGCDSDDDDNGGATITDPDPDPGTTVPDADNNGIPDAFETLDTTLDTNENGIVDSYDAALTGGTDSNTNLVDDSFEVALTGGTDANNNGIDDAVEVTAGTDPDPDPDTGTDPDGADQTGPLNEIPVGDAGVAAFTWDGSTLSGQVDITGDVAPSGAALYSGIINSGVESLITTLNGGPTYFVPTGLAEGPTAAIADNIVSGNLFVRVDFTDGSSEDGLIRLNGVEPKFTALSGDNSVPAVVAFSNGEAYMNFNTVTGDYAAVVNVNLDASDLDADGNPQIITAADIHMGAIGETGDVIVNLADSSDGLTWTANGVFNTEQLATVLAGDAYFNVLASGNSDFLRGQIPATQ